MAPYLLVCEEPKELGLELKKKSWWGHGELGAMEEALCYVKEGGRWGILQSSYGKDENGLICKELG